MGKLNETIKKIKSPDKNIYEKALKHLADGV